MRFDKRWTAPAAGLAAVMALSGCGREADRASRPEILTASESHRAPVADSSSEPRSERTRSSSRRDGARLIWAASRRRSAEESALRQFDRNGADFGARSVEDYAAKARAFVSHPPRGVQTINRSNGDVLYYDAANNVFAVADSDGVPKAMFKPRDGRAYWDEQKQRRDDPSSARRSDSRRASREAGDAQG